MRRPRRTVAVALAAGTLLLGQVSALAPGAADTWRDEQYWLEEYGFTAAWERTRGEGITVAVIDTGIDAAHPDLAGQVVGGTDVSGVGSPDGTQPVGTTPEHGTLVASLLAGHGHTAAGTEGSEVPETTASATVASPTAASRSAGTVGEGPEGILGVAPGARLLSVSVDLGADGSQGPDPQDQIAEAVRWSVDQGADVITMSLGSDRPDWPESWDRAFLHAEENDVVVVAAAGNRASGTMTAGAPATIPGVLTVAGLSADGTASWDASTEGISIGVAAPADSLVGARPGGGWQRWQGTSGAAPLVAGLAALVRSAHPEMSAHQVIHRILATAHDAGIAGEDPVYGHGIIDAGAAVSADVAEVDRNPMDTLADWIRVHRRAEDPGDGPAGSPAGTAPAVPRGPASGAEPPATAVPQVAAVADPAPGLQPGLVLGSGTAAVVLLMTGLVLAGRGRHR